MTDIRETARTVGEAADDLNDAIEALEDAMRDRFHTAASVDFDCLIPQCDGSVVVTRGKLHWGRMHAGAAGRRLWWAKGTAKLLRDASMAVRCSLAKDGGTTLRALIRKLEKQEVTTVDDLDTATGFYLMMALEVETKGTDND